MARVIEPSPDPAVAANPRTAEELALQVEQEAALERYQAAGDDVLEQERARASTSRQAAAREEFEAARDALGKVQLRLNQERQARARRIAAHRQAEYEASLA